MYWACAQLETNRTAVALHFLKLGGFEVYCPRLREQRRNRSGRKIVVTPPLFPGYTFVLVVSGWWDARWSPGVVRLIMDGLQPAHVPATVIDGIKSRERNGLIELPKSHGGLKPGTKVRVVDGPLASQIGVLLLLKPRERVLVLLSMLGGEQRVDLAQSMIEVV